MSTRAFTPAGPGTLGDRAAAVEVSAPRPLADGFRPYERFDVRLHGAGAVPLAQRRDILRVGPVVAVLPVDPVAGCFVLIRQFRLAAHLATGLGDLVELVAGGIEPGEDAERAAARECAEEIGVAPQALLPMMRFLPTPGVTDEYAALFLGRVDSRRVPAEAGAPEEAEHTRPFTIGIDEALAALDGDAAGNVFLIAALQWFALRRAHIGGFLAGTT
ncbi:MAG TPA: NUDIX domain-containing protein [Xanthobacteraceae bacterium]|nr:NUDIX domain-containing protein [Xanthobacteraceae bacterium]